MHGRIYSLGFMALVLASLLSAQVAAAGNGERPLDAMNTMDRPVEFAFTGDWAGTYQTNRDAWTKELAAQSIEPATRDQLMAARTVRLLEVMLDRCQPTPAQRRAAETEIGASAWGLGVTSKSLHYANRIVDENPGDLDAALVQFSNVLRAIRADAPWEYVRGGEYLENVARRVVALNGAGLIPDEHPIVRQAWQALFKLGSMYGRLFEARQMLNRLAALPGHEAEVANYEAEFTLATGDVASARRRFTELGRGWETAHFPNPLAPVPDFPRQFDVEARLSRFYDLDAAAQRVESLAILQADTQGKTAVAWEEGRRISAWALMDRFLAAQKSQSIVPLREIDLDKAKAMLAKARSAGDSAALLATYRTFPWSAPGHEALADLAEIDLLNGRPGMALRSFREVLSHATDAGVRHRAQVGVWMALAQDPGRQAEFQASFNGVNSDAIYPWMGKQATAQVIRQRLSESIATLAGSGTSPAAAISPLAVARTGPVSPWSRELFLTLHADFKRQMNVRMWATLATRDGLAVGGPNALMGFGPDVSAPRWVRTAELPVPGARNPGIGSAIPASANLSVGDGRIYCAWGMHPPRIVPEAVAAFEESSGRMLWSTQGDAAWADMAPVGSPVYADGRVYVVAAHSGFQMIMHLVCLDARTGATLWRRHIVSQRSALTLSDGWPSPNECDLSYHGCNLAVRDGAVYLHMNLGMIARCDARDGVIEWITPYPRACARTGLMAPRQGSAPVIVGEKVIFAPRDALGLMAVDSATGKLLWHDPTIPSAEMLGLVNGKLLVVGQGAVAAVDPEGGRVIWFRPVPEISGKPALAGERLYVPAAKLLCLSVDDGAIIEEAAQPAEGPLQSLAVVGTRIYGVGGAQCSLATAPLVQNAAAPAVAPPPNVPVAESWSMRRQFPDLLVPPAEAGIAGRVYVSSQGVLECVEATPRGTIQWRAVLPLDLWRVVFAPRTVLVVGKSQVTAYDALTGESRWNTPAPLAISRAEICAGFLVLAEVGSYEPGSWGNAAGGLAAIDLASGKVLWKRPAALGSHNLLSITWDGKDILLTSAMEIGGKGTFAITCRPSDGVFTTLRRLTPAQTWWRGNGNFVGVNEGMFYYFPPSVKGPAYRVPLDGSKPAEAITSDFSGMIYDTHKPELITEGEWLMVRGHQTHVYRKKDMTLVLDRTPARAGPILGNRLFEFSPEGLTAIDLVSGKQAFHSLASAGTQYNQAHGCPDIRAFDSGIMVTNRLYNRWDNGLQKYLHRVLLELLDPETGGIKTRQLLGNLTWVPTLENDREADAEANWVNGMLIVADTSGVYAYCAIR